MTFAGQIKRHAEAIGFDKVGIVAPDALVEEGERLRQWLGRGFHGEMEWMEREPEKRSDPRAIFPAAKSVVVVAANYYTDHKHHDRSDLGKISRYAWGDDYHDVVREKLNELLAWIRSKDTAADGKVCVDTAPIMDKAWAVRAGLGWLGKHSNVITKEFGSWVFIGELILNIELDFDTERIEDHCGTCTACLDACPTQAIVEPYTVDSRRCLSYATIELRAEEMPPEFTANMDGWIYGCDICQDVCPWNRFETPTAESRFRPRNGEASIALDEVFSMTPETYAERFRGSAIKRAKLPGLKRNAAALRSQKRS